MIMTNEFYRWAITYRPWAYEMDIWPRKGSLYGTAGYATYDVYFPEIDKNFSYPLRKFADECKRLFPNAEITKCVWATREQAIYHLRFNEGPILWGIESEK